MEAETPFQKVETFHKTFDPRRPEICSDPQKLDFFGVEKSTPFFML
ncbi:hypothetical protein IGK19_001877 [Enterococcus sp. DIV0837a]